MNLQDTAAELVNQGKLPLSTFLRMLNSGKFSSKIENMKKENPWHKMSERKNILKHTKRENPWRVMVEGERRYSGMVEQMKSKPFQLSEEEFDLEYLDEILGVVSWNDDPLTPKDCFKPKESDLEYFIRTGILRNSARKKLGWLDGACFKESYSYPLPKLAPSFEYKLIDFGDSKCNNNERQNSKCYTLNLQQD